MTIPPAQIIEALSQLYTVRDLVRWGASQFNAAQLHFGHGFSSAWDEALYLVRHTLHLSADEDQWLADACLLSSEREQIIALFQQRVTTHKPAAYLTHEAWFAGLPFYVDERVIIPRSPIAELIEQQFAPWVEESTSVHRILDLCTGSGCIAIACALAFPEALVDAVDIAEDALQVAAINVQRYHLEQRLQLLQSDLFAALAENHPRYDVIVCNPPYVDAQQMATLPQEFKQEPALALAGGEDGLDLVDTILQQASNYLTAEGILIVEVGYSEAAAVQRFSHYPLHWLEFERGGSGVFVLTQAQLQQSRASLL